MEKVRLTIRVDIETGDDHVSGWVDAGTGPSKRFDGWIGLISAIDTLVAPTDDSNQAGERKLSE